MKVSSTFSKVVESRGKASGRAPQSAELSCAHKSAGGGLRGNPRRGFPLFFVLWACACAPLLWVVVEGLSCHSTPFLWCLPKETVSSRQRKALFLPRWLHHSRERYRSVDGTFLARLWGGLGACRGLGAGAPFSWVEVSSPYCPFHPISLLLRKETGWSPKETRLWVPPRKLFGPARLSHGLEAPTSQPTASS